MNRKFIIAAILILIIPIFALMAFADESFLKPGGDVKVGEKMSFKINLKPFEDFESYRVYIKIEPDLAESALNVPMMYLGANNKELADIVLPNPVEEGEYYADSADIRAHDYNALSLYLISDEDADVDEDNPIPYIVTVTIKSENLEDPMEIDKDGFDFLLLPKEEPTTTKPTEPTTTKPTEPTTTKPTEPTTTKPTEPTTTTEPTKPTKKRHGFGGGEEGDGEDKYKGSSDNYLKELSVSGYEFSQTFHKTRTIYFVDLDESVSSLDVHAVPCDKAAKVDIAGNSNISGNLSKIVIDVRAVNGEKRRYTIYVRQN